MPTNNREGKPLDLYRIHHELIADRGGEAWYRIPHSGPYFKNRWSYGSGGDGEGFHDLVDEHRDWAVSREEPSLTMGWGMAVDWEERRSNFPWAQGVFVDPKVTLIWADFFWCGSLIDRVELARVDGSHGLIPPPRNTEAGLTVTQFEAAVAYLVHDIEGGADHDHPGRYLESLGIKSVFDDSRWGAGRSD